MLKTLIALFMSVSFFFGCRTDRLPITAIAEEDGLDTSVEAFIGKRLLVKPFYGWGWARLTWDGVKYVYDDVQPPDNFHVQLTCIWSFEGVKRRGGIGRIVEPGYPYDGFWVIFSTRHVGKFNFTDHLGDYNIDLTEREPVIGEGGWPAPPKPIKEGAVGLGGFADISGP